MSKYDLFNKPRDPFDPKLRAILLEYTAALNEPVFPGDRLAAWQAQQNHDKAGHVTRWAESRLRAWRNDTAVSGLAPTGDLNGSDVTNPHNTKSQHN